MKIETEKIKNCIKASSEVDLMLSNLEDLNLAEGVSVKMTPLLNHLKRSVQKTMETINRSENMIFIGGPDWCRQNSFLAAQAHAEVIISAYGNTYALPNKNPKVNKQALDSGNLEMFLMFEEATAKPVGTACTILDGGWAELGRAASLGRVGNRIIQDLRIIRWLTEPDLAQKTHSIFATLRTAPDRNIGSYEQPEIMRGGQGVCRIWSDTPEVKIAGIGPLYKKHGALEQFAFAFITQAEITVPNRVWIADDENINFVQTWLSFHNLPISENVIDEEENDWKIKIGFPPLESGITNLVHGEMELGQDQDQQHQTLAEGLNTLNEVGVPFIQFAVPIDINTNLLQKELKLLGFHAFQFTPGLKNIQPPKLWFGKITDITTPVVSKFWEVDNGNCNPFWKGQLTRYADEISQKWKTC